MNSSVVRKANTETLIQRTINAQLSTSRQRLAFYQNVRHDDAVGLFAHIDFSNSV